MIRQDLIDEHAEEVSRSAANFAARVGGVATDVGLILATKIQDLSDGGVLGQDPATFTQLLAISRDFHRELGKSEYHQIVVEFVTGFTDQVEAFNEMHAGVIGAHLGENQHDILAEQGGVAVGALEGHAVKVGSDLHQLMSRSLVGVPSQVLSKEVILVVRKLTKVEQIAKDHLMIWFRLLGDLVYSELFSRDSAFVYVGPSDSDSRSFCEGIDGPHTRDEIDALENGQVPGVFHNGGGYGCNHFWVPYA